MSSAVSDQTPVPSFYARTAPPDLCAAALQDHVHADVAVVGAGFTGISTALHLAKKGVSVAMLEGREVGWGGSGRAFGQVVPYAKHDEQHIISTYGPEYGARLIDLLASGPDIVFDFVERYRIACEPVRAGLLFAAHTDAAARRLERRAEFWQERSAPVELLGSGEVERVIGSRYYPVALLDRRGGTVNPFGYARGLARIALKEGARLFEKSPATAIKRRGDKWVISAGAGEISVDSVVLATDAYTGDVWPGLRASITPVRAYHVLSSPLSENVRRTILPGGQSLTDSRRLYSGMRVRADGRLQMSVDGPPFSNDGQAFAHRGTMRARSVFPQLGEIRWEEQAAGWVGVSYDQYPHIHRLDRGVFGVVGLSGRGIAFGTLLGMEVTKRVLGDAEQDCAIPLSPLRPMPGWVFTRSLVWSLINLYRVLDKRDLKNGYVKPATTRSACGFTATE